MSLIICIGIVALIFITINKSKDVFLGANYFSYECLANGEEYINVKEVGEKYFRPSSLPIMNNKEVVSKLIDENYLCTPYHGWANDGELSVEIKYGNWCKLVKVMGESQIEGYEKKVYFEGIDNNEYMIVFYTLTNDNDVEIAQYVKNKDGDWKHIYLDSNNCLKNN